MEVPVERGDAGRRDPPRHDVLARHAAARAARARHDERRQARAARREDAARSSRTSASSISSTASWTAIPGGEAYTIASPVAVYKNLAIFPGRTGEHNRWGIPGDLRGFDLLTGKEVWRFHTVPHPGDPNFGTWGLNGWQDRKGPGSWQPLTVDNENGLVFVALGNAVDQNYGNSRPGSNLYSASVVALDAATGKYKWHFQTAHHDIYDGDLNAPPMFAEVNANGQRIPGDRADDEDRACCSS